MAIMAEELELAPNEFAFYFEGEHGVDADALANFLKRAATVARQQGGELRVVGLRGGSLAVIVEAIKKSKIGRSAVKEFSEKPIDTTVKVSGFLGTIVGAIIYAMLPAESGSTPLAKAGADVVENHQVTRITIVTNETSTVVMDEAIASEVRKAERSHKSVLPPPDEANRLPRPVIEMIEDARRGNLSGKVALVGDELHFRPDGYRYWVPVDETPAGAPGQLFPGVHYRVTGRITTRDGQPDRILIDWAAPIE